jgi:YidC/Oxa1 family membrane protein insertase
MERRFILFLVLSFGILGGYSWLMNAYYPPKQRQAVTKKDDKQTNDKKEPADEGKPDKKKPAETKQEPKPAPGKNDAKDAKKPAKAPAVLKAAEPELPEQWITLGSADPKAPYHMLVTLTTKGAALSRIELNAPYCDIDNRSGYLGQIMMNTCRPAKGCAVQLVGPGTPAAEAGLKPGDVITALGDTVIDDQFSLDAALRKTKPNKKIAIQILRDGKPATLEATLRRRPLEIIKPEGDDPLSMLLTLQQFDDKRLADVEKAQREKWENDDKHQEKEPDAEDLLRQDDRYLSLLRRELDGVKMRTASWKIVPTGKKDEAQFNYALPEMGLEIVKTYRLAQVPDDPRAPGSLPGYHIEFEIEIRNVGAESHKVAYRLDGPNGLPTEGRWYASKVSRNWGAAGLRDFIISMGGSTPGMVGAPTIAEGKKLPLPWPEKADTPLTFIGVDAQYFSAVLMPSRGKDTTPWFDELMPIRVGRVDRNHLNLTNTSCRMISSLHELKAGDSISNKFKLFTGPKKPVIIEPYGLSDLIYFGWPIFAWFAVLLTHILHFFYAIVDNYGLAIILLTILVRGCMFPLSLKQAAGAQKMQLIQPEMKKLQEKHKNDSAARAKAQQELFRKHNYNPLSGCLPLFIQMPVFIGLYRSLMVAIELRDAPLFTHSIRWCSNLAAPDMLYDWSGVFSWPWFKAGVGIFALGPYFNLLPIMAIVLMIVQMKMFTPPPADEQAAVQQKVMKYMMVFMGLMFFKVASGLCIYFIVSSGWGLVERRFLPKTAPVPTGEPQTRAEAKAQAQAQRAAMNMNKKK